MAKTLRTSGDYTIKTGTGASGSNTVTFDSKTTRVSGDLVVDGSSTTLNTTTLTIEDPIIRLAKNNTNTVDTDSGFLVERGLANNAAFYWNEGDSVFKAVTTTSDGTGTSITDTALANIRAAEPSATSDVATKNYVDTEVTGAAGFSLKVAGDDSAQVTIASGNTLQFTGASGIATAATEPDTITISLGQNLTDINSIDTGSSNGDLILRANGTGDVVINDTITFSGAASTPSATAVTKLYNKTAGGGGTGLFFINSNISSGTEGELISKKKATALAIALG
jgi:hypothetical protein|tara:strand:+ start:532 stop:1374 length:843 start_codon:yes stop_codon:yes gene_type:complete